MPENQFAPFNKGIFKETVIPEPEASTQAVYGDLDSVVQAVFTNQGADPSSLLSAGQQHGPVVDQFRSLGPHASAVRVVALQRGATTRLSSGQGRDARMSTIDP